MVALQFFELRVAEALLTMGDWSGKSLRFVRKSIGYNKQDLANLLGLTEEIVSGWERPEEPTQQERLGHVTALLLALVNDALAKKTTMRDALLAGKVPKLAKGPIDLGTIVVPPRWSAPD